MPEEPCQCPDCQRFYREHDRLIRENPTLRQQQELNWEATEAAASPANAAPGGQGAGTGAVEDEGAEPDAFQQAMADLENINAHLFSIEALMERIFDVRVPDEVEQKFREVAGELAPDPLNADRLRLNRLLHQTPDLPG